MSFALLGKVAKQDDSGAGARQRPLLASFAPTPQSLRSLNRPGMMEHACLDALLGVLWAGSGEEQDGDGIGSESAMEERVGEEGSSGGAGLGAATVTWTPMIFRDPAAGATESAAAALGRANAARHALALAGS